MNPIAKGIDDYPVHDEAHRPRHIVEQAKVPGRNNKGQRCDDGTVEQKIVGPTSVENAIRHIGAKIAGAIATRISTTYQFQNENDDEHDRKYLDRKPQRFRQWLTPHNGCDLAQLGVKRRRSMPSLVKHLNRSPA